ncbi:MULTISPECIES: aspartyl-phosphate phosphatase Spo0E family protein [Clostridium]|uniref:Aspartyl-phosphate phosphatase Spo0E family protein n=2 Tax=Clostridium tagluense TaxID=360422 RepID=A0A401UQM6_9CLOT|nr:MULTISPECIES: aspartyl-phosphate phosphatase Spo0E family protein [Clostridium]MBU3127638.1 aspartyl-phosphate phosphatase Spo0E family protein [Clostridium tagluense]MBW9155147.1 aspartyl-phosphate phosphatase Spo0E family protein [Clostridium tagluense]MBZ9624774.1 aspartyl-phosphate phosphatase Spo0E family protein [Clostridium sp. FP2]MBZ9636200.1 aspartyl-phosphate phosphatase Spo0E family protein [Clostridium sp. FP1]MCB2311543.1 aspartyl-phosphate phosphatase Spo0E family protein [Cl
MNKRYKFMNIKLQLIKRELESLRLILHFLLNFKKPTDKIVVSCSQQLDEVIVKYEKVKATCKKVA